MRLKLMAFSCLLLYANISNSELITVCASGCNQTTLAAAKTACVACTIQINDNSITNETLSINGNTVLAIQGLNENIVWGGNTSNTPTLGITAGLTQGFLLRNITITQGLTGNRYCVNWSGIGNGSAVTVTNVNFINSDDDNGAFTIAALLTTANQFVMQDSFLNCTGNVGSSGCFQTAGLNVTANSINLFRDIIQGNLSASSMGIRLNTAVSATTYANIYNCDIRNFGVGYKAIGVTTVKNCIITGNTDDINLTAPASGADLTYTGFGENLASPGTGCVTITSARAYVNSGGLSIFDFRPSPASTINYAGNPITGVTDVPDFFGNLFNVATPSMGAAQYYCPSGMGYGCN